MKKTHYVDRAHVGAKNFSPLPEWGGFETRPYQNNGTNLINS
jgi:hypothetical protein